MVRAERLHSIQDAADLLGVSRDVVERLMRSGELTWTRAGARRRIRDSELADYQDRNDIAHRETADRAQIGAERGRQRT
jgi:excisionase family DNA binding protein